MSQRITRVNELLRREISMQIYRIMDGTEMDLAEITISHVETSPDLRHARVFVSVRGEELHGKQCISLLNKKSGEFQRVVSSNVTLKYTPRLRFRLNRGIERGEVVIDLLEKMETDHPEVFHDEDED